MGVTTIAAQTIVIVVTAITIMATMAEIIIPEITTWEIIIVETTMLETIIQVTTIQEIIIAVITIQETIMQAITTMATITVITIIMEIITRILVTDVVDVAGVGEDRRKRDVKIIVKQSFYIFLIQQNSLFIKHRVSFIFYQSIQL